MPAETIPNFIPVLKISVKLKSGSVRSFKQTEGGRNLLKDLILASISYLISKCVKIIHPNVCSLILPYPVLPPFRSYVSEQTNDSDLPIANGLLYPSLKHAGKLFRRYRNLIIAITGWKFYTLSGSSIFLPALKGSMGNQARWVNQGNVAFPGKEPNANLSVFPRLSLCFRLENSRNKIESQARS